MRIWRLPIGVNLRGVAAGGANAPPLAEGSRIKMVPSLDPEKELLRGGLKRVDCCGSLCAGTTQGRFQPQRVERALGAGASHLIERRTSKHYVCADIR
jgi:hypothetical protein